METVAARYRGNVIDASSPRSDARSKIVETAAGLLREHGPAALTTRRVAEAAGVQAPAIYRLFGDKDGLLDAVAEHTMATYVGAKTAVLRAAATDDVDPFDDLRAGWETQIDFGVTNPAVFRLLSDPERVQQSPAARSGRHVLESRVHRIALTGRLRVSEERAVNIIHAAGTGTVQTLLSLPPEQRDADLAASMYEAALRQILTDPPHPPPEGPAAVVVAFRALAPQLDVLSDAERHLLTDWLDRVINTL
jgi:AcrR family transcriptional regulator